MTLVCLPNPNWELVPENWGLAVSTLFALIFTSEIITVRFVVASFLGLFYNVTKSKSAVAEHHPVCAVGTTTLQMMGGIKGSDMRMMWQAWKWVISTWIGQIQEVMVDGSWHIALLLESIRAIVMSVPSATNDVFYYLLCFCLNICIFQ